METVNQIDFRTFSIISYKTRQLSTLASFVAPKFTDASQRHEAVNNMSELNMLQLVEQRVRRHFHHAIKQTSTFTKHLVNVFVVDVLVAVFLIFGMLLFFIFSSTYLRDTKIELCNFCFLSISLLF